MLLRSSVGSSRFIIRADWEILKWILVSADALAKLVKLGLQLLEFNFAVNHRSVLKHDAYDSLSRMTIDETGKTSDDEEFFIVVGFD